MNRVGVNLDAGGGPFGPREKCEERRRKPVIDTVRANQHDLSFDPIAQLSCIASARSRYKISERYAVERVRAPRIIDEDGPFR